jgi:hypothetical protein
MTVSCLICVNSRSTVSFALRVIVSHITQLLLHFKWVLPGHAVWYDRRNGILPYLEIIQ